MNRLVAFRSRRHRKHVGSGQRAAVIRQRERWPRPLVPSKKLVCSLDVFPRKLLFDVQVQTDERERQLHRFGALIRILRGKGIDYMLMDERWIAMRERIIAQFVVGIL